MAKGDHRTSFDVLSHPVLERDPGARAFAGRRTSARASRSTDSSTLARKDQAGWKRMDANVGLRLLSQWTREWEPDLRSRSARIIGTDLGKLGLSALLRCLAESVEVSRTLEVGWRAQAV